MGQLIEATIYTFLSSLLIIIFSVVNSKGKLKPLPPKVMSIILTVAFIFTFTFLVMNSIDLFKLLNKNYETKKGLCDVYIIEDLSERFASQDYVSLEFESLILTGDRERFPDLKEGEYECEVSYTKFSEILLEVNLNNK